MWKVGPLCVKRWQSAIPAATVRAKCRLSRHPDFAWRWYLPWLHWSVGAWVKGRQADFTECNVLACRYPWARDLNPSNVLATASGPKIIDFQVIDWPPDALALGVVRRFRELICVARLPGGGESRDVWKLGPLCIKRWSPRISPAEVRARCRVSREIPVCNRMCYAPWLHWTLARWVAGKPATHEACNRLLARFPELRDLHPGNVVVGRRGAVVVDFGVRRTCRRDSRPSACEADYSQLECADPSAAERYVVCERPAPVRSRRVTAFRTLLYKGDHRAANLACFASPNLETMQVEVVCRRCEFLSAAHSHCP